MEDRSVSLVERYKSILNALPFHIFLLSETAMYIDVLGGKDNPTGVDCKPFIGHSLYEVVPQSVAKEFHSYIRTVLDTNNTKIIKYKLDTRDIDGMLPDPVPHQLIWFEAVISPLPYLEQGERAVAWIASNVTQRHLLVERLRSLSHVDDLTGLANRRAFTDTLGQALQNYHITGQSFSTLMVDIDHFKLINDKFGHAFGDVAIQHAAQVINHSIRNSDYAGRIGGDEFAVILFDASIEDAYSIAEKIRNTLAKSKCQLGSVDISITVSIGVTPVQQNDIEIKTILARADRAMYAAKRHGRNAVSI